MTVEADLRTLTEVLMGDALFVDATANQRITLEGPSRLTRRIPAWFGQHPRFAKVRRAASRLQVDQEHDPRL